MIDIFSFKFMYRECNFDPEINILVVCNCLLRSCGSGFGMAFYNKKIHIITGHLLTKDAFNGNHLK